MVLPNDLRLDKENGCAFLVGNGINVYSECCESWKDLVKELVSDVLPDYNIDSNAMSFPIVFEIAQSCKDDRKNSNAKDIIKNKLSIENVDVSKLTPHKTLVEYAKDKGCPILTLNYDNYLEHCFEKELKECKSDANFRATGDYRWNMYYADKKIKDEVRKSFGIWHIHGDVNHKDSIRIGHNDYMNMITKLRNYSESTSINSQDWTGLNTWLEIFYNSNLIIMGTRLDPAEIDLYWLLIKRKRYIVNNNLNYKTYYFTGDNKEKDILDKKALLDKIGIEVIDQDFDKIYNDYKIFKGE